MNRARGDASASTSVPSGGDQTRSCQSCRIRKIKCDRKNPCANCTRSGWTCEYPSPPRKDAGRKIQSLEDIVSRLERLESLFFVNDQPSNRPEFHLREDSSAGEVELGVQRNDKPTGSGRRSHYSQVWEILLEDGSRTQYVNNANILDLLQDVIKQTLPCIYFLFFYLMLLALCAAFFHRSLIIFLFFSFFFFFFFRQ